jgi:hypothetical protein
MGGDVVDAYGPGIVIGDEVQGFLEVDGSGPAGGHGGLIPKYCLYVLYPSDIIYHYKWRAA